MYSQERLLSALCSGVVTWEGQKNKQLVFMVKIQPLGCVAEQQEIGLMSLA